MSTWKKTEENSKRLYKRKTYISSFLPAFCTNIFSLKMKHKKLCELLSIIINNSGLL